MDDGSDPNELAYLTPEILMEMIPTMERFESCPQLEDLWDGPVNPPCLQAGRRTAPSTQI